MIFRKEQNGVVFVKFALLSNQPLNTRHNVYSVELKTCIMGKN